MKWVRRNVLQKRNPYYGAPVRMNTQTGQWERVPDEEVRPYRSYSKWHLLHETKSESGQLVSLCGQLRIAGTMAEVSETQPASGRRSYRTQNPTCYYCRIVADSST